MAYLVHHGIKGQEWGVRRGPPYPLDSKNDSNTFAKSIITKPDGSKVIPKGFEFNRIGKEFLDINAAGGLYVSHGENDVKRYIRALGPSLVNKLLGNASTTVQHISTKEDLRMPSDEQFAKTCAEAFIRNQKLLETYNKGLYSIIYGNMDQDVTKKDLERVVKNPNSKDSKRFAYSVNSFFGDPNYLVETKELFNIFRQNGFDVLPDLHDSMSGTSENPFIIINPNKVNITSTATITKNVYKEAKAFVKSLEKLKIDDAVND